MKFKNLIARLTGKSIGNSIAENKGDGSVTLSKEQAEDMDAMAGEVETLTSENTQLKADLEAAKQEAFNATQAKDALNTKVTELEAEVKALGKQPGNMGAEVIKEGADAIEGETVVSPFAAIEAEKKKMAWPD